MRALTDQLEAGITGLFQSGQYAAYLQSLSKLHHYSYGNIFLIKLQCPHASMVAGYGDWKRKFGRHVKAGETGITILAPCPYWARDEVEETGPDGQTIKEQKWVKKTGFTTATVFDVSQTEGRELPSLGVESLTGTVEGYEKLLSTLKSISPVPVSEGPLPPGVHGAYYHAEQKITLSPGMSEAQTIKTLVHEIAHAKLHALPVEGGIIVGAHEKDRRTREVEAESVAYTVCQYLGLDTRDYAPASRATSPRSGRRWKPSAQTMQGGVLMKKLLHADLTAILGLIPLYQPTEAGSIELDLLKLQQGGAADYLFLARRERSWLFDPPRVYEPGSYENLCWLAFQNRAGWPVLALFLHVEKFVGGRPWGSVTLLDYREAARDAETFSALAGPQRERHLKLMRKRYLQKVQYCSILEVIQYLKTGR